MDKLLELVRKYCQQRNLIEDAYIQGMTGGKQLDEKTVATLTRYHKEWMRSSEIQCSTRLREAGIWRGYSSDKLSVQTGGYQAGMGRITARSCLNIRLTAVYNVLL